MRRDFLVIAAALLIIVAAAAVFTLSSGIAHADILTVTTDKGLYHSNEVMKITIDVTSSGTIRNTLLRIEGIQDRYGDTRLLQEIPANLSPGMNTVTYDYHMPACSHCAGLDPGTYSFNVTLEKDGMIFDQTNHSIYIEQ